MAGLTKMERIRRKVAGAAELADEAYELARELGDAQLKSVLARTADEAEANQAAVERITTERSVAA